MIGGGLNLCLACRDVQAETGGGLARAMRDLAEGLAGAGHRVHLLTNRSSAPLPDLPGVQLHPLFVSPAAGRFARATPDSAPQNIMHAAAVYREVRRIHEQDQPVDAVLAPLWRSEAAVCVLDDSFPTIVSCMTSIRTLVELGDQCRLFGDIHERLALEHESLRHARYLHGLTEAVLAKTVDDFGLDPVATAVIGRGLRDRRAPDAGEPATAGPVRVLFVGRIERRKGVDTLLAAARELIDQRVDVAFTLAGPNADPSYRAAFEREAARDRRLAAAIQFAGAVSDPELIRLYERADIVCIPSRYESHGIVLLEAMMFGKPIVSCDAGGIGEVARSGRDALLVAPDQPLALAASLRELVGDPALRARLGAAARQTFEHRFEIDAVADQMRSFFELVGALQHKLDRSREPVGERLERLLCEVLPVDAASAATASRELLDPSTRRALGAARAFALRSPAPSSTGPAGRARVTAVVLTRDRPELVARALDSIQQSELPAEILVIDNASSSAVAARVEADCARRASVSFHRSDVNLGCAGGRRFGAQLAQTELVLFLDDDAELMPGALAHLVAELDANPSAGAATATVVDSDGLVWHSGGRLECTGEVAVFEQQCAGQPLDPATLPASGPTDWVPGTAVLIRRALLSEFELDERMSAYFEDAEWSYRVALARPGSFRRSREALAVHHQQPLPLGGASYEARSSAIGLAAACARFYQRHGLLLGPALFDAVPKLHGAGARLLMELLTAKGPEWTLDAWNRGELAPLLDGGQAIDDQVDRAQLQAELTRLRQALESQDSALALLRLRAQALSQIEQGGWWRLRSRVLPLLRLATRLRDPHARPAAAPFAAPPPSQAPDG